MEPLDVYVIGLIKINENNQNLNGKLSSSDIRNELFLKISNNITNFLYLKKSWSSLLQAILINDQFIIDFWFDQIFRKYSESWKYYHTFSHIFQLLNFSEGLKNEIKDECVLKLAIFFHDVIYQPWNTLNEEVIRKL